MGALTVRRLSSMTAADRRRMIARSTASIFDAELARGVAEIIDDVREHGDAAILRALERFDGVECPPDRIRVGPEELEQAQGAVGHEVARAIRQGITNIRAFNKRVLADASWTKEIAPGIVVGEQARPISSAGLFVPSGKGSFPPSSCTSGRRRWSREFGGSPSSSRRPPGAAAPSIPQSSSSRRSSV